MKKVVGQIHIKDVGDLGFEFYVDDAYSDSMIKRNAEKLLEYSIDYTVEYGYKKIVQETYVKDDSCVDNNPAGSTAETAKDMIYNGYSSHDDESHYKCPMCNTDYGSWSFINGSVKIQEHRFRCTCGTLLNVPR